MISLAGKPTIVQGVNAIRHPGNFLNITAEWPDTVHRESQARPGMCDEKNGGNFPDLPKKGKENGGKGTKYLWLEKASCPP